MDAFGALADPTRRRILELLGGGERSAGTITEEFDASAPAISQHLKVLREAGLVRVRADGQRRLYSLEGQGLEAVDTWLARVRRFWGERLAALEHELARPDRPKSSRRRRGTRS